MARMGVPRIGFLVALLLLAAGCDVKPATQHEAVADHTLFVADSRNGQVRVFDLRNGPVMRAMLIAPARRTVLGLRLDAAGERLWVLGNDALYAYDARSLVLQRQLALPTNTAAARALDLLEDGTPLLVSAGRRYPIRAGG
jgi:hypothetical protein